MAVLDENARSDIQGNILRAYGFRFGRYSILRIVDPAGARRLLTSLLDQKLIISAATWDVDAKRDSAINVSLTYSGLAAIGVSVEKLATFPAEFIEGMAARSAMLGDTDQDDPKTWAFGNDPAKMHVFITVAGRTPEAKDAMLKQLHVELAAVGAALEVTHRLDVATFENHREHFGYADGIGQPNIEGSGVQDFPGDGTPAADGSWKPLKAGEFVLGYEGETGFALPMPAAPLGHNGSFMVYRQLAQDVPAFREFLRQQAARVYETDAPSAMEKLAAKLVGRWRSGCPLMRSPDEDKPEIARDWNLNNDFLYQQHDAEGAICPLGSHIRRMNPRDGKIDGETRLHRIVRRGLPYGSWLKDGAADDGTERGVAFMAINASLKYQFEFLQREWSNSGEYIHDGAGGSLEGVDVDPLCGQRKDGAIFRMRTPDGTPKRLDLPRFVTLRGGGYFFIPSLTALRAIADGTA